MSMVVTEVRRDTQISLNCRVCCATLLIMPIVKLKRYSRIRTSSSRPRANSLSDLIAECESSPDEAITQRQRRCVMQTECCRKSTRGPQYTEWKPLHCFQMRGEPRPGLPQSMVLKAASTSITHLDSTNLTDLRKLTSVTTTAGSGRYGNERL